MIVMCGFVTSTISRRLDPRSFSTFCEPRIVVRRLASRTAVWKLGVDCAWRGDELSNLTPHHLGGIHRASVYAATESPNEAIWGTADLRFECLFGLLPPRFSGESVSHMSLNSE